MTIIDRSNRSAIRQACTLLNIFLSLAFASTAAHAHTAAGSSEHVELATRYARVPLQFEENRGQLDPSVAYAARGIEGAVYLTSTGAVFALRRGNMPPTPVRATFEGGSANAVFVGEDRLATTSHYFSGNDPAHWRLGVASFSRVRFRDAYPGIDIVYHGNGLQLEYDLLVAPGARPDEIDLRFDGVDAIGIDREGDLILHTAAGDLRQKRPIAYQMAAGRSREVPARYVRRGPHAVGIVLGKYDHALPLTIDPLVLFYAGYLGGNTTDQAFSVAVDSVGNAYVAGSTESLNFPVVNAAQPALKGTTDVFVSKINAAGTALTYSTYLGGSGLDAALGIALDPSGNVYIAGYTNSIDFPATPGVVQSHLSGQLFDAFVAKIAPNGTLQYATYLGGHYYDTANAIAVDSTGNAYVAGFTCSYDFPTRNAFQPFLHGGPPGCFSGQDAFVSKLNPSGTALIYSTFFGGSDKDEASAIAIDSLNRVAIAGHSTSSDLPTVGLALSPYRGARDAFIARFSAAGSLDYSSYFGGTGDDTATGIAVGKSGDIYVTGYSDSVDLPTRSAFQPALAGPEDGFAMRFSLSATSAKLVYSSYIGGGDADRMHAIAVDSGGNAYLTGYTESIDFPTLLPSQPMLNGPRDAAMARIDSSGALTHSTFLGGSDEDNGWSLAIREVARAGTQVYVAGETMSTDLGTNASFQPNAQGASDGFVARLGVSP